MIQPVLLCQSVHLTLNLFLNNYKIIKLDYLNLDEVIKLDYLNLD